MNPKSKMVSFRLSADEYTRLHQACSAVGARSVSELARAAMSRLIDPPSAEQTAIDAQVRDLRSRLDNLCTEFERLANRVAKSRSTNGASV